MTSTCGACAGRAPNKPLPSIRDGSHSWFPSLFICNSTQKVLSTKSNADNHQLNKFEYIIVEPPPVRRTKYQSPSMSWVLLYFGAGLDSKLLRAIMRDECRSIIAATDTAHVSRAFFHCIRIINICEHLFRYSLAKVMREIPAWRTF